MVISQPLVDLFLRQFSVPIGVHQFENFRDAVSLLFGQKLGDNESYTALSEVVLDQKGLEVLYDVLHLLWLHIIQLM